MRTMIASLAQSINCVLRICRFSIGVEACLSQAKTTDMSGLPELCRQNCCLAGYWKKLLPRSFRGIRLRFHSLAWRNKRRLTESSDCHPDCTKGFGTSFQANIGMLRFARNDQH